MPSSLLVHLCLLSLLVFEMCLPVRAVAFQDTVVFRSESNKTRKGRISDWQGNTITLISNNRERRIDTATVEQVQTDWPEGLLQGRKLFAML